MRRDKQTKATAPIAQDGSGKTQDDRAQLPWLKFHTAAWLSNSNLLRTSWAARGVWIALCAHLHQIQRGGYARNEDGSPTSDNDLAAMLGGNPAEVLSLLGELEAKGVLRRAHDGAAYSSRMARDCERSAAARVTGSKGGNPALTKAEDNREDIPRARTRAGVKELRVESRDTDTPLPPEGGVADEDEGTGLSWQEILKKPKYAPLVTCLRWTQAWDRWLRHRRENKYKVPRGGSATATFNRALEIGAEAHADAIYRSIEQNYAGLFPRAGGSGTPRRDPVQAAFEKFGAD